MSLSTWYHHQYASWNRTRRLAQPQYIARNNTATSRVATTMSQGATNHIVVNIGGPEPTPAKDKKAQDALFGPSIGPVSSGPAWTNLSEKKVLTDELTPDVIRSWIEKSKEPSHPTTTLQALVNLKRPTLRLSPLSTSQEDGNDEHHHHLYGLEFEYDSDAPKCGIYLHVLLSKDHPDAPPTSYSNGLSKLLVYESVVDGGFGKILKLEDGATLELGRFERIPKIPTENANNNASSTLGPTAAGSETAVGDSSAAAANAASDSGAVNNSARHSRLRFTHFHFRKRSQNRSVSGPALAVVDADPAPASDNVKAKDGKEDEVEGIRVIIRLAALDEQGTELASPNEQLTYLHIVRFGAKPTPEEGSSEEVEDTRAWVVKVVKREATIGPHTFHLHEIYGLSSSSATAQAAAPTPVPSTPTIHTYPPQNPTAQAPAEDEPSSECLLCLSSPREVVLLPCRHLVACKECALNMVEFGAGGAITQVEEPVAPPPPVPAPAEANGDATGDNTEGPNGDAPAPTPAPAPPPVTTTRRKRRAKGWFCPVCRQPYTSLLRITANPPPAPADEDKEDDTQEGETPNANGAGATETRNGGLLASAFGTSFLRNLSFSRPGTANPGDVESQGPMTRVGA
ncbi:hypothetical protein BDN72DRAFT_834572 [Pluteus cervinus]|uniref:Uncharacterized protein n=1 Tax=Pluteus cervinus TaxID=181527 RepID=A0ACD3B733_9AGAR|nr:hypothetical protein BDN72DRAFT_834572 [Pluteus cervinus]